MQNTEYTIQNEPVSECMTGTPNACVAPGGGGDHARAAGRRAP
eukprot:COSAG02_NODE_1502_length_12258_cov_12.486142_1_plen_42_part_10